VIRGQRVTIQIDSGATHNFIDSSLVARRGISTKEFEGLDVEIAGGKTLPYLRKAPRSTVSMGNYNMIDDFNIVYMAEINVVLGVQWLNTLGTISTNYQTMELGLVIALYF